MASRRTGLRAGALAHEPAPTPTAQDGGPRPAAGVRQGAGLGRVPAGQGRAVPSHDRATIPRTHRACRGGGCVLARAGTADEVPFGGVPAPVLAHGTPRLAHRAVEGVLGGLAPVIGLRVGREGVGLRRACRTHAGDAARHGAGPLVRVAHESRGDRVGAALVGDLRGPGRRACAPAVVGRAHLRLAPLGDLAARFASATSSGLVLKRS